LKHNIDYRFDVIAIHDNGRDINWIENAISEG
ncbi:YraN family protein, partial [Vibrio parahaemolyticus]|nr:YraN family protein [Vibrio parahaemolyticus]